MQTEPLFQWSEPIMHYVGFLGSFLAAGAVGFRYSSLAGAPAALPAAGTAGGDGEVYAAAARRGASLGLIGAVVSLVLFLTSLPEQAERMRTTTGALLSSNLMASSGLVLALLAVVGFALAWRGSRAGWVLAAVGVIVGALRGVATGQWARLVNPVHMLAASLWIGTLFVLLFAGIAAVFQYERSADRRGALVADMVNRFSPLALGAGATVVLFGLITGWRHLRGDVSNLWTTPYGYALMVKLVLVAVVFALGAWNWRRQRPTLGSEGAALSIRRSAASEVGMAALVLVATAILVSIPAPRPPGGGRGPGGAPPPGAPAGPPAAGQMPGEPPPGPPPG